MTAFGKIISDARKKAALSQKELASRVLKEDGEPISPQYLNDIEHDRRNPPGEFLIERFAKCLDLPVETLLLAAGILPEEVRQIAAARIASDKPEQVAQAFRVFRKKISGR